MRILLLLGVCLLGVTGLYGQAGPIESLVERSPFLPPGYRSPRAPVRETRAPEPVSAAQTRFELVGVVANEGEITVSIRRKGQPRGKWLAPGESLDEIRFIRFNLAEREAVVEHQGRRETIPLKAPSVTGEIPVITMNEKPSGPPPPPTGSPAIQQTKPDKVKIPVRRRVIVNSK